MRYRLTLRSAAAIAAAAALAVTIGDGAAAQTLTNPNPQPAPSRPPAAAKPRESEHVKSCSAYGAGFVNIPGTGACVKIGGSVTVDSGISRGR
jgi:Porin subfamily